MTVSKIPAANVWFEPPGADDGDESPIPAWLQLDGSEYVVATDAPKDASLLDWHNDGAEYEMVITGSPMVQIDSGGGVVTVAASGTPFAILIDDAGGLVASTNLALEEAGAYYAAANGSIVAVRFDANEVKLTQAGTTVRSYEDA